MGFSKLEMYRTNHILGIAINEYDDCNKLFNAVKDVEDFIELTTTHFDFEEEDVTRLYNGDATRTNILNTLRLYAQTLTEYDNLIIYFSGHGTFDKVVKNGYWIPTEAKQNQYSNCISNSDTKDHLAAIKKAHHIFLISDACFSSKLILPNNGRNSEERHAQYSSRWCLTSGRGIVSDGIPGTNSPFAQELEKHLKRAISEKKSIGVQRLCIDVMETFTAGDGYTEPNGEPLRISGHDAGQFYFTLKEAENVIDKPTKRAEYGIQYKGVDKGIKNNEAFTLWQKYKYALVVVGVILLGVLWTILPTESQTEPFIIPKLEDFKPPVLQSLEGRVYQPNDRNAPIDTLNSFKIGQFEVTNKEFLAFLNDKKITQNYIALNRSVIQERAGTFGVYQSDLKRPVTAVSWYGASAYCKWLTQKTGKTYRLPTSNEWEYAANGGLDKRTLYAGGDDILEDIMWCNPNANDSLHTIGTRKANAFKLYDMSGNAAEWCQNWHDLKVKKEKIIRGGSVEHPAAQCRIDTRIKQKPTTQYEFIGFRIVQID